MHNSTAVIVVHMRPRAIPLAMITMRKSLRGLPLVSYMGIGLRLAAGPPELCYYGVLLISSSLHYRSDLAKPASTLYMHNLTGVLETAIRATNAQYADPEIIERLDCRLLEVCAKVVTKFVATFESVAIQYRAVIEF